MNDALDLHYRLRCLDTGDLLTDEGTPLANARATRPAFLRTEYTDTSFSPGPPEDGIYRFEKWLPIRRRLVGSSAPVTYRSKGLAEQLGLSNLYITFSGYWPERNCRMLTGTFKECEAYSVCARRPVTDTGVLVVASAGNTARAFARVCSDNAIPLVLVVPEHNLPSLWSIGPLSSYVRLVVSGGDSDYADAIALSDVIAQLPGFVAEGGAKNVARRDGMGTTVLSAADVIGEIPHHYFQAVGSGTGAIAAWESTKRLVASGQFGTRTMKLHVCQNAPFTPIHDSWQLGTRDLLPFDVEEARRRIETLSATVLANRKPPYGLVGGLFDALSETGGTTAAINNEQAAEAAALFESAEGIDVSPAAAVAVANLVAAASAGTLGTDDIVMLNVTGGGLRRIHENEDVRPMKPARVIGRNESDPDSVKRIMNELF